MRFMFLKLELGQVWYEMRYQELMGFPSLTSMQSTVTLCTLSITSTNTCQKRRHQTWPIRDFREFCSWSMFGFNKNSSDKMEVSVHTRAHCSYQSCKEGHSQMPEVVVQQSAVHHVPEDSNASWLTQRVSYRGKKKKQRQTSFKQTGSS